MSHRAVRVRVPATSANLGPGFDCLALALALYDEVHVQVRPPGPGGDVDVVVAGEGAGTLATDDRHLVARAVHVALDALGEPRPRLSLSCTNAIPQGRGLGSSAAAVVAGLLAGRSLAVDGGRRLDDHAVRSLAAGMEGHPDNVAAALAGGLTVSWSDASQTHAVRLEPHRGISVTVLVPRTSLATETARGLLPATVPHEDAAHSAGRAALLVVALTERPDLLHQATEDRLHQRYRADAMPETDALVHELRREGRAAVVSGAGPSVLVFDTGADGSAPLAEPPGWQRIRPAIDLTGARVVTPD